MSAHPTETSLQNKVVVITGASSGIGMATAIAFARERAHLFLAARNGDALDTVVRKCLALGTRAEAVPTDCGDAAAVRVLASVAAAGSGGIDVWVNNAGVGAVGDFTDTPVAAHERVIRTNLLGYIYGAHAALPYFMQRQRGILINTISLGAWVPTPYAVAYSASKYGLEGYSQSLRAELLTWPDIHICNIYPSVVNTPGLSDHAAIYNRPELSGLGLAMQPEKVAQLIVKRSKHPRFRSTVGTLSTLSRLADSASPSGTRKLAGKAGALLLQGHGQPHYDDGSLFHGRSQARIYGADPAPRRRAGIVLAAAALAAVVAVPVMARIRGR